MLRAVPGSPLVADDRIVVGRIAGVFGVKGWIKVQSFTEPRGNIASYNPWLLGLSGQWKSIKVELVRDHGKTIVAKLDTVQDCDAAALLVGCDVAVYRQQLPDLQGDEFYWHDLQGLRVVNLQEQVLGVVDSLFETGANDVLVVKDSAGHTTLIPYVRGEIVLAVDLALGRMQVDWGLDY